MRPGSMVNVMLPGATPVETEDVSAGEIVVTAKVSLPAPALLMERVPCASPGLQGFCERKTCVALGAMMGRVKSVESGR